ncbi:MAG TPA: hypothetical protein VGB55_14375, partial [Tepidisphaeraceae bacterium]
MIDEDIPLALAEARVAGSISRRKGGVSLHIHPPRTNSMFQSLESRRLFAAQIGLSNGLVTVTGSDTLRDEVTMTFIDGKVIGDTGRDDLRIDVIQRNSAGKQVSSVSRQFSLFDVTGIKVDTRGGDDKVLATNVFDVEGGIRNITVLGGSGNDEVKGDYEQMTFIDGGS